MKRLFGSLLVLIMIVSVFPLNTLAVNANAEFLLGDWSSSDGVYLSFYDDETFMIDWGSFYGYDMYEEGRWSTGSNTYGQAFTIHMDGSSLLTIMSLLYGATMYDYHFEILKCNNDNFYLVQVYDDYTAESSPCKLGFTRDGARQNFNYVNDTTTTKATTKTTTKTTAKTVAHKIESDKGDARFFAFQKNEEIEDLVLSNPSTQYSPRLACFLCYMARAAYNQELVKKNLEELGFKVNNKGDYDDTSYDKDDLTVAYSIAKKSVSNGSTLVMITVRGSDGLSWVSNAALGLGALGVGKHAGFENDALEIFTALKKMVGDISNSNITYVLTGHSQGGAAANLLAVKLHDNGVQPSKIYDYNFACPNVACLVNPNDWNPGGVNSSIFNIGNVEDPVTFLPSNLIMRFNPVSTWGKFGQTYWFFPDDSDHNIPSHDMVHYVNALSHEYSLDKFVVYSQISVEYIMRIINIRCPVDANVYDKSGNLVISVIDNEIHSYVDSNDIIVMVNGDEKYICLPMDRKYDIRLTATDSGKMNFGVGSYDLIGEEALSEKWFDSVELTKGKEMYYKIAEDTEDTDAKLYVIGKNNKAVAEIMTDGTETQVDDDVVDIDFYSSNSPSSGGGFPWWGYLIVGVGAGVLVVAAVAIVMTRNKKKKAAARRKKAADDVELYW